MWQAEIIVDNGVFHLDLPFSYAIPVALFDLVTVGSVVKVPFKNETLLGVVLEIKKTEKTALRAISSVVATGVLSPNDLALAQALTERYVGNRFDILQQFLPPLTSSTRIEHKKQALIEVVPRKTERHVLLTRPTENVLESVVDAITARLEKKVLVVVPTSRDLDEIVKRLKSRGIENFRQYDSTLKPAIRRDVFSAVHTGEVLLVIGLRSSILLPFPGLDEILVLEESSEHFFEKRSPYWNVRDVALMRSEISQVNVAFISSSISLELWRLVQMGWIKLQRAKNRIFTKSIRIQTLPDSYHSTIREGLSKGAVLVSVSTKSYSNSFICRKCRTPGRCSCGGKILILKKDVFECSICEVERSDWKCSECNGRELLTFRGGAEKVYEEIGKAFPKIAIFLNTADKPIGGIADQPCIVISTFGIEPEVDSGFAAVIYLDGEELINRPFIRAEEEVRHRWFRIAGELRAGGSAFLSLPASHSISQSFLSGKVERAIETEIRDREEVKLPPHIRLVRIQGDTKGLLAIREKLASEFAGRASSLLSHDNTVLTIKVEHDFAITLLGTLRALQKLRSASNKELFKIEVDPYLI